MTWVWGALTAAAVARRFARKFGAHSADVYPIFRLSDHRLVAVYVRDVGRIPA